MMPIPVNDENSCPITLGEIDIPLIGRLLGPDKKTVLFKCEKHPYSVEGMIYYFAYKFWENPQTASISCATCTKLMNVFKVDIDPTKSSMSTEVRNERRWAAMDCAKLADRMFEFFIGKLEKDGENAVMHLDEIKKIYLEITEPGQMVLDIPPQQPDHTEDVESNPPSSSRAPSQRLDPEEETPVVSDDSDDCCLAKMGAFNIAILVTITVVFTLYIYFRGIFRSTPVFEPRGRTVESIKV